MPALICLGIAVRTSTSTKAVIGEKRVEAIEFGGDVRMPFEKSLPRLVAPDRSRLCPTIKSLPRRGEDKVSAVNSAAATRQ